MTIYYTCNALGIRYSGVIGICWVSVSIFHLNFIIEKNLLDIVIISDNLRYWIYLVIISYSE